MSNLTPQAQKILMKAYNLRNEGKLDASLKQAKAVFKKHPQDKHVLYLLGSLYLEKHEYTKAQNYFKKGMLQDPKGHANQGGLGATYYRMGKLSQAKEYLTLALSRAPNEYSHKLNFANVSLALGEIDIAESLYRELFVITPEDIEIARDLSGIYMKQEKYDLVEKILIISYEKNKNNVKAMAPLASFYENRSLSQEAREINEKALAIDPDNIIVRFSLFGVASQEGNKEEAIEHLKHIVSVTSNADIDVLALALKSKSSEEVFGEKLEETKSRIIKLANDDRYLDNLSSSTLFNLSHIYETYELFDESFRVLKKANDNKKEANRVYGQVFDRSQFSDYLEKIKNYRNWPKLLNANNYHDDRMVFILAMPRSGTTLLEQILAAHPLSDGIGESLNLDLLKNKIANDIVTFIPHINWPDQYMALSDAEKHALSQFFINGVEKDLQNKDAKRIVEKSIGNFLYVGLLAAIFPKAHFIYCRRNRAASGLSIYQQDFANQFMFDNDLDDINFMFDIIEDLMATWISILGDRILTIDYETLVADPESQAKSIIDYIGLDWDPACLEFHKQKRVIKTASLHQARNAVYSSSADRYLNYQKHLGPLL